jgi:PAS domain S-box-containing protein
MSEEFSVMNRSANPKELNDTEPETARRNAELQDAQQRISAVCAVTEIGTWTYEIGPNRVVADANLGRMFGVSPEEAAGGRIEAYLRAIHPNDQSRVQAAISKAIKDGTQYVAEYRIVQRDGTLRSVIARGKVERDETGKAIRMPGVVLDITERVHAEDQRRDLTQELQRQSRVLETVMSSIQDFAYTFDTDGRFVFANKPLLDLWGLTLKEAVGKNFFDLKYPPELAEKLQTQIQQVIQTKKSLTDRTPYTSQTGSGGYYEYIFTPVFAADGSVELVAGSTRDITEQHRVVESLQRSEENFRQLADAMPQIVWAAQPDGTLDYYNQRWFEYINLSPAAIDQAQWDRHIHPEDLKRASESWATALRGDTQYGIEIRMRSANAEYRWFLVRALPIRNAQGAVTRWFGTGTDIHEHRQLMGERDELISSERAARKTAEQASRLKDEFLATLSHELRTPLNAILGWSQILRRRKRDDKELNEGLSVIERNSRAQAQLIEDLLDMSRIISGKIRIDVQQIDLAEVISAAIEAVRPAAEAKEIHLDKALDPNIGLIRGDPARLQQVIWNLLSNAIKFTPGNGNVQVTLKRVNNHVEITVSDTGIGIKLEFLPYVFERFRQADATTTRQHGGLGLGMAIVKNLVELHGGKVRAKSPGEGRGATFTIELPLTVVFPNEEKRVREHQLPERGSVPEAFCESDTLQGVSVLVVDDDEDARDLVCRLLEECKAKVFSAGSAAEAVELLKRERPAVIVSDIGMPDEDGYDLIRKVRLLPETEGGSTPAAALTAFARSEDRTRALRAGYQSHVAKPVEPNELIAVVASLATHLGSKKSSAQ